MSAEIIELPRSQQLLEIQNATNAVREFLWTLSVSQRCEVLSALLASAICEAGQKPEAKESALAMTRVQIRMTDAFKQLFPQEVPFV